MVREKNHPKYIHLTNLYKYSRESEDPQVVLHDKVVYEVES